MGQWYIQNDIPYQKEFPALYAIDAVPELHPWYILTDIPYQKEFETLHAVNEMPTHEGIWKIKTDIPYQPTFPKLYNINEEPELDPWYILEDIPYQKGFIDLYPIDGKPLHAGIWRILNDIPYQPTFPKLHAIDDKPPYVKQWYILEDIPYQKWFPELHAIDAVPYDGPWYILNDIPYRKEFHELHAIDDAPLHPKQWNILYDIPYQLTFVELLSVDETPYDGPWYILDDIPYREEFIELYEIDATPKHKGQWYILEDIPYQKEFIPLIPIDEAPNLGQWYILNDIPYMKEFVALYAIDAIPKTLRWYILNDIPYRKEFPPLYGIDAIPKHYIPKYYMVVGVGAIGRWQVRKCRDDDTENWQLIEDLGPPSAVLSACIEADGDFDYIAGNDSITLTTTDTPWMAVITTTKKLYVKQVCADLETAILLDTGVEQASLCRGWKSDKYSVDSGLICAYRKSNGVFAKVYKKVNGEYVWETLPQLLYEPVEHVEVKRLNDYRIGVYVTNPNRLLLSERFYIGGTSKTEYVHLKSHSWVNVATAHTVDEPANQDFTFLSATIENERFIRVHGKYPIYSIDRDVTNVTLTDSYHYSTMVSYTISNGDILIEMDKPKLNAYNLLTVIFSSANHIKYTAGASRTGVVPGQTISVENKFVPDEYVNLTATATVSELVTVEKQQYQVSMPIESVILTASTTVSEFKTTPLNKMVIILPAESVVLNASVTVSELTTTQSGDLPV